MKSLPYLLYLILIAMHEVIWRDVTSVYGVSIDLTALLVTVVALYKTEMTATWFGFVAGIIMGASNSPAMGWHALVLSALGLAAYHVRERLNLESLYARLLLMFGASLAHSLLRSLIEGNSHLFYLFWTSLLPGALYTTIVVSLFFVIKDRMITVQKLKSIF